MDIATKAKCLSNLARTTQPLSPFAPVKLKTIPEDKKVKLKKQYEETLNGAMILLKKDIHGHI